MHGVDLAFCVPGESYLGLLDGLYAHRDRLRVITCRHEAARRQHGGRLRQADRPARHLPGHARPRRDARRAGVHTALQDSTPMILFVGQVAREHRGREAFQEVDYEQMFGPLAKWVFEIDDADAHPRARRARLPRRVPGRPGPVVLALPEDVLLGDDRRRGRARPRRARRGAGAADARRACATLLARGRAAARDRRRRRLDAEAAATTCAAFAEAGGLPVGVPRSAARTCSTTASPIYCRRPRPRRQPAPGRGACARPTSCSRSARGFGEIDDRRLHAPRRRRVPRQTLVHVHAGRRRAGRVYRAALAIVSALPEFAAAARALEPLDGGRWADWRAAARARLRGQRCATSRRPATASTWPRVRRAPARARCPTTRSSPTAPATTRSGCTASTHSRATARSSRRPRGAMGYGVPAAVAAKLVHPERAGRRVRRRRLLPDVRAGARDGGAATARRASSSSSTTACYGTIRMHQERHYPGRVIATDLVNPDFAAFARSFGAYGERVGETGSIRPGAGAGPGCERARAARARLRSRGADAASVALAGASSGRAQRCELTLVLAPAAQADGRRQRALELRRGRRLLVEEIDELEHADRRLGGSLTCSARRLLPARGPGLRVHGQ